VLADEASVNEDLLFLGEARDDRQVGCVDKTFAWYAYAVATFRGARYIGKTDDDSLSVWPNLVAVLRGMRHARFVYGGWLQFSSWLPNISRGCGWSAEAQHALRARCGSYTPATTPSYTSS